MHFTCQRGKHILESPSSYYTIVSDDKCCGENTKIADIFPRLAIGKNSVCTSRVCLGMTTYDELTKHHWKAHKQNTPYIYNNESGTTILTADVWETPYVAQANGSASSGKYHTKFRSEITSFLI